MTSDETKLLIGRIERAISRIEASTRRIEDRPPPAPAPTPHQPTLAFEPAPAQADPQPGYSRDDAIAALKSLDGLIAKLESGTNG